MNEKITQIVAVDIIPNAIAYEQSISAGMIRAGEPSLNPMAVYLSQLTLFCQTPKTLVIFES